jgi:hypothetical protein
MKAKNSSGLIVGIVITVFVIIIVGVVIIWSSGYFNQNKKTLDRSTSKIDKAIGSMAEFDLEVYDGKSLRGDALVELIKEIKDDGVVVSIGVKTLSIGPTGTPEQYNYTYGAVTNGKAEITPTPIASPTPPTDKSNSNYINPNGSFVGQVIRNKNDEIVAIEFTQQK